MGRELVSWAKPLQRLVGAGFRWRAPNAVLVVETSPPEIAAELAAVVYRLLSPLYMRFDGFRIAPELVESEIAELLANRRNAPGRQPES